VLVWPARAEVDRAVRDWAQQMAATRPELRRVGYFGSYARDDWGVGSDVDLVVIVSSSDEPRGRRSVSWDVTPLPVPADLLIYTEPEWAALTTDGGRFARMLIDETVWVL
jgi:predicted nucleotidyltransferase